jgi:hypothetical protein
MKEYAMSSFPSPADQKLMRYKPNARIMAMKIPTK